MCVFKYVIIFMCCAHVYVYKGVFIRVFVHLCALEIIPVQIYSHGSLDLPSFMEIHFFFITMLGKDYFCLGDSGSDL